MLTFTYPERIQLANSARTAMQFAGQGLFALLACAMSIGTAWFLLQPEGRFFVLCAAFFLLLVLIAAHNLGVATAVAVVAVLNGLPGLDLEQFSRPNSFRFADLVVAFLLALLAAFTLGRSAQRSKSVNRTWLWAILFFSWWLFTLLRTVLLEGVPIIQAALYGRDFLYFALIVALIAGALREKREIIGFFGLMAIAGAWHAFANISIVMLGVTANWLIHPILTTEYLGLPRIYAYMTEATILAVTLGAGLALLASRRIVRVAGAAVFLVSATGVLLQLGRMLYYSLALGLLFAVAVWMIRPTAKAVAIRRTVAILAASLVTVAAVAAGTGAIRIDTEANTPISAVPERAFSGIGELTARSGTVGYRQTLTGEMGELLEGHLATGLGFLHPSARPMPGLPDGSIRNSDVGVFNSLMTMGVVGTALLYAPLLVLVGILVRASWRRTFIASDWLGFTLLAWTVAVLVGSISLTTLFSVPGLVLAGCIVGCGLRALDLIAAPSAAKLER